MSDPSKSPNRWTGPVTLTIVTDRGGQGLLTSWVCVLCGALVSAIMGPTRSGRGMLATQFHEQHHEYEWGARQ